VVAVTAYSNVLVAEQASKVGILEVLSKPVSEDELKRILDAYYYERKEVLH
jgi:ActR/RegA family two-component response regulator